jgi:hypothetical protein
MQRGPVALEHDGALVGEWVADLDAALVAQFEQLAGWRILAAGFVLEGDDSRLERQAGVFVVYGMQDVHVVEAVAERVGGHGAVPPVSRRVVAMRRCRSPSAT